jgi:hypothetical protein
MQTPVFHARRPLNAPERKHVGQLVYRCEWLEKKIAEHCSAGGAPPLRFVLELKALGWALRNLDDGEEDKRLLESLSEGLSQ